jgi:hypothetical protein
MPGFAHFIELLCDKGEVLLRERPRFDPEERAVILEYLIKLHGDCVLELAGPAPVFDEATAMAAAQLTWRACWFLVSHEDPPALVEEQVRMPARAGTASSHFSADLILRFLPQIHRRANARSADDVLSKELGTILRQWPLSGVLSSVTEEPLTPVLFEGHRGLLLLYAERWSRNPKPLWRGQGLTADYCDWIRQESKA